jgi:hypothetical protein
MIGIDELADYICEHTEQSSRLVVESLGIRAEIPWLPEYVMARDRYFNIPRWLRWTFRSRRQEYEEWLSRQQAAYLNAVIQKTQEAIDNG